MRQNRLKTTALEYIASQHPLKFPFWGDLCLGPAYLNCHCFLHNASLSGRTQEHPSLLDTIVYIWTNCPAGWWVMG